MVLLNNEEVPHASTEGLLEAVSCNTLSEAQKNGHPDSPVIQTSHAPCMVLPYTLMVSFVLRLL